jgi:hypothetical protein
MPGGLSRGSVFGVGVWGNLKCEGVNKAAYGRVCVACADIAESVLSSKSQKDRSPT